MRFLISKGISPKSSNSGVQALAKDGDISQIREAIDFHLRLLADYLIHGDEKVLPWGRVGGKDNADPTSLAVGAITLAYVRNRICAPRDMSANFNLFNCK